MATNVAPALFEVPTPDPDPLIAIEAGHVVETEHGTFGDATAVFDESGVYRFHLSRVWDPSRPRLNVVMLNPSRATAFRLDPTVRRCLGFAAAWGMGALAVTNCFALRSPYPRDLRAHPAPVGPGDANDRAIVSAARTADLVVAAWGAGAAYLNREAAVRALLAEAGADVHYLTLTGKGHPGHPLYLDSELTPRRWVGL